MCTCSSRAHPQVPHSTVTIWLEYCHQCDAWQLATAISTHHGGEYEVVLPYEELNYGPFDDMGLVLDDAKAAVERLLLRPGRPWDTRA